MWTAKAKNGITLKCCRHLIFEVDFCLKSGKIKLETAARLNTLREFPTQKMLL